MQASCSSSSCYSLAETSLTNRLHTIFKKAYELSTLCEIEVCVIHYGPDGELKTWPEDRDKVKDMALRYNDAKKRKKSLTLHDFLGKKKQKRKEKKMKKKSVNGIKYPDWYPEFDHYSPHQLSQLILSLEKTLFTLQERFRFLEAEKQRNTDLVHEPSQFSLYMYNHGDDTLSQLPLSASQANQLTNYQNHLMMMQQKEEPYGFDHISNTQDDYSELLAVQETARNHLDLYGSHENMCMGNVLEHPCYSNTVSDESCSDFLKNPIGGSTSLSQDMFSSYDQSNLLQASSSQPSLHGYYLI